MAMRFIEKVGGSLYYLSSESMGSYGEPEGHPNHRHSIVEMRGGHKCGLAAISYVAEDSRDEYFRKYALRVHALCKRLMAEYRRQAS